MAILRPARGILLSVCLALVGMAPAATVTRAPAGVAEAPASKSAAKPSPGRRAIRIFGDNWVLRYQVRTSEDGFGLVTGRSTYVWRSQGGRYSLVSTLEATGLAALVVSGKIVQVSEGRVDAYGLHPEYYKLQRNAHKKDVARLDWGQNRIVMEGRGEAELTPQAQDLLSFAFFLAMTAREGEAEFTLGVTNGRKFRQYLFHVLGRETLDQGGARLATLHVHGEKAGEGELDVWLDPSRSGLPVRIRTVDRKGQTALMRLEGAEMGGSGDQP